MLNELLLQLLNGVGIGASDPMNVHNFDWGGGWVLCLRFFHKYVIYDPPHRAVAEGNGMLVM